MDNLGIFTPTPLQVSIDIQEIVTLHYYEYTRDFRFTGEKHDFWEFAYVDRGEVGVAAESDGFDLRQGEAIFHKPGEYHNIWAKNQFANIVIVSFVCHSPAIRFFENKIVRFSDRHRSLLGKILEAGEACFRGPLNDVHQTQLQLEPSPPFAGLQVIKNYLELLLIRLIQDSGDFSRRDRSSATAKIQGEVHIAEAVQQFLQDNLYGNVSFDDVLREVCFSKSYLTKLFRKHTGCSVMEYYLNLKITEAQRLISGRELSFTEIAELLQFSSIHYFSRIFKKKTGMSPSEYERSVRSMAVL